MVTPGPCRRLQATGLFQEASFRRTTRCRFRLLGRAKVLLALGNFDEVYSVDVVKDLSPLEKTFLSSTVVHKLMYGF